MRPPVRARSFGADCSLKIGISSAGEASFTYSLGRLPKALLQQFDPPLAACWDRAKR
jgi:hypothetical protein